MQVTEPLSLSDKLAIVRRLVRAVTLPADPAYDREDLFQDAWLRLSPHLDKWRGDPNERARFSGYVRVVLRNLVRDRAREVKRRQQAIALKPRNEVSMHEDEPTQRATIGELRETVGEEKFALFCVRFVGEWSWQQIAAMVGVLHPLTAKRRVDAIVEDLRKRFREGDGRRAG